MPEYPPLPTLLYHPDNPAAVTVVVTRKDLFRLYRRGFKQVALKKLGATLKKLRKKKKIRKLDVLDYLQDSGIYMSEFTYTRLERGTLNFLPTSQLGALATFLSMPLATLTTGNTKAHGKNNKFKKKTSA